MKPTSSLVPVLATILLHGALIALVITGLSQQKNLALPKPVPVQLLAEQAIPAAAPAAVMPAAPAQPEQPPSNRQALAAEAAAHSASKPAIARREPIPPRRDAPAVPAAPTTPANSTSTGTAAPVAAEPSAPVAAAPASSGPAKTGVSIPASYAATNRKPPYPLLSRHNDEQGVVQLRVFVKADGSAGEVQVSSSSGYPLLDESAKSAVQTWRFNPATVDGKPVGEWYYTPVKFTLHD